MSKSSNKCRPTGNTINTITYPCGITANYVTRPGSNKAETIKRLHAKGCEKCGGKAGKIISTVLPTRSGNIGQVTAAITRDILLSGSGVRISSLYGEKNTPATSKYNEYIASGLAAQEAKRQSEFILNNSSIRMHGDCIAHAEAPVTMHCAT